MSIRDSPVSTEADEMHAPNTSLEHSRQTLKHMEEDGDGGTVKIDSAKNIDKQSTIDSEERYAEDIHTGHVSSVLFVCMTFILGVVGILFLSPVILLVNNKEQLVNDLMFATAIRKNKRGRPQLTFPKMLKKDTGLSIQELKEHMADR